MKRQSGRVCAYVVGVSFTFLRESADENEHSYLSLPAAKDLHK